MFLLQAIGVTFGLVMLYLTWHYYNKNTYTYKSLTMWFFVWIAFIIATIFPETLRTITQTLSITRPLDLFTIGGLFGMSALVFYLYITVKKTEKKVEDLVSELAKKK